MKRGSCPVADPISASNALPTGDAPEQQPVRKTYIYRFMDIYIYEDIDIYRYIDIDINIDRQIDG